MSLSHVRKNVNRVDYMRLFVANEPKLKGLKILIIGILIAFVGALFAFIADAFNLGRVLIFLGWIIAVVGLIWHWVILFSGKRNKEKIK
jgi:hypothetical protein